jgi:hypothetical protein
VVVDSVTDQKLFVLDLSKKFPGGHLFLILVFSGTMLYSLHDIEWDDLNFNAVEDTKINHVPESGEAQERVWASQEKLANLVEKKKLPFGHVAMVIHQTMLFMFGGCFDGLLSHSYLFAIDLSQLLPYLSLEQHAAIAISKNKKNLGGWNRFLKTCVLNLTYSKFHYFIEL